MPPEVIIPLVSASISSVVGATALVVTHLSRQRTERIKHAQDTALERERLRFIAAAYEHAAGEGQAPDLVDLTRALRGDSLNLRQSEHQNLPESVGLTAADLDSGDRRHGKRGQSSSVRQLSDGLP